MAAVSDSSPGKDGIELQNKAINDKDKPAQEKDTSDSVDKPPTPPKRDYNIETSAIKSENRRKKVSSFFPRPEVIYSPETSRSSMTCLRNCLVIFNLLIWLFGAALTGLGLWIRFDPEFLEIQTGLKVTQFTSAAITLIVAGVVIMVVGFIGCYGAMAQKVWMLIIFSVIIVIVILMELTVMGIVWSAVSNKNMQEDIKARAKEALQKMDENKAFRRLMDLMQIKLHCCGVNGPSDYNFEEDRITPIPKSCTNEKSLQPYEKGCAEAVIDYFKSKAAILGGIALAVFILQLAVLVFTICVICGIKHAATSSVF
ncbi:23 kDa integral membrane protein-like [Uloborus diversus]|uniref:23 kDa integral membrane protein-like n=1 Tax=Uloborus diversus TaxID=327109 RepID=UPI00240A635A|nr:23 kDa integral membrane protein-like [Uloborus diversus]